MGLTSLTRTTVASPNVDRTRAVGASVVPRQQKLKRGWSTFTVVLLMLLAVLFSRTVPNIPSRFPISVDSKEIKPQEQEAKKKEETKGLDEEHKDSSVGKCALEGSMNPPANRIIIDFTKIHNIDKDPLERLTNFTANKYVKHMLKPAGVEHYSFLNYISATYGDCRHFMDIGTRYVTSALALGSNQRTPVWTFDIPKSKERFNGFRGKTEDEWQKQVHEAGVDIVFHNVDLMNVSDAELKKYIGTWFVMLDTFHWPDKNPFEREFVQRIRQIGFKGILALDDIYLNHEMKKWWKELEDNAEEGGYATYDLSKAGHFSGTGLVDFSGKVTIKR